MKKVLIMLFISLSITACSSPEMSFNEVQNVPEKIQDALKPDYGLQIVYEGEDTAYISFPSKAKVTADYELEGNVITLKFEEENQQSNEVKPYVYKLTRGEAEYDTIHVEVNGQAVRFDMATGVN